MVLKDDYNKDLLIIDEENLIYKSFFRKVKIKRREIRSIFYNENKIGILLYNGKIYSFSILKLLHSEKFKLEILREELNKENILFDYTGATKDEFTFYWIMFFWLINSLRSIWVIIIAVIILVYINKNYRKVIIYNIDKEELEVIFRKKISLYKKCDLDKIEIIKPYIKCTVIKFFKDRKRYKLYFEDTPYLIKNYNISLNKFFNRI